MKHGDKILCLQVSSLIYLARLTRSANLCRFRDAPILSHLPRHCFLDKPIVGSKNWTRSHFCSWIPLNHRHTKSHPHSSPTIAFLVSGGIRTLTLGDYLQLWKFVKRVTYLVWQPGQGPLGEWAHPQDTATAHQVPPSLRSGLDLGTHPVSPRPRPLPPPSVSPWCPDVWGSQW